MVFPGNTSTATTRLEVTPTFSRDIMAPITQRSLDTAVSMRGHHLVALVLCCRTVWDTVPLRLLDDVVPQLRVTPMLRQPLLERLQQQELGSPRHSGNSSKVAQAAAKEAKKVGKHVSSLLAVLGFMVSTVLASCKSASSSFTCCATCLTTSNHNTVGTSCCPVQLNVIATVFGAPSHKGAETAVECYHMTMPASLLVLCR